MADTFNFWNGRVAHDVDSLQQCISQISNEEFLSYVNGKNDFANWVRYSIRDEDLAFHLKNINDRQMILMVLREHLEKEKAPMIVASPKSFSQDELVKEVMAKNDAFLGIKENAAHVSEPKVEETPKIESGSDLNADSNSDSNRESKKIESTKDGKSGSSISFIDMPKMKMKHSLDKEFFIGITFGMMIGILLTLIVLKIYMVY